MASLPADRIAARAGIAALEGRIGDALVGYGDALTRYRTLGTDMWRALAGLDFVTVVGSGHPATREAAAEAREIFERVGARRFLDALDAAVAGRRSVSGSPDRGAGADDQRRLRLHAQARWYVGTCPSTSRRGADGSVPQGARRCQPG